MANGGTDRWDQVFSWAVRVVGLVGFLILLTAFLLGRDVATAWLVIVGGMIGLEPLLGWRRRQDGEG